MKQIEIKTTLYLTANVPDNYEPQLEMLVEDGCASLWLCHNRDADIVAISAVGQEVIHEEDVLD